VVSCPFADFGSDVHDERADRVPRLKDTAVKYMILTFASQQHY
jgi:hypothetical protein